MTLEYLQWDSEFFNRKIGRIIYNEPEEKNLKNFIKKAKSEHYQLLYVFSPENLYISESILAEFSGKLVDRKVLYFQNLMNERQEHDLDMVIEYPETEISEDLQSLAYLSGAHSRFFFR